MVTTGKALWRRLRRHVSSRRGLSSFQWGVVVLTCVGVGAAVVGGWRRQWIVVVGALFILHVAVLALAFISFRGVRHLIRAGRPQLSGIDLPGMRRDSLSSAGCAGDYLALARTRSNRVMESTCLRTGSVQMRDVLAYAVSRGLHTYAELEMVFEAYRDPQRRKALLPLLEHLDVPWLLSTARVVALQRGSVFDRLNAVTMYEIADWVNGSSLWQPTHCLTYLQLLCELGQHARANALLDRANLRPAVRPFLAADVVNPFTGSTLGDGARWQSVVNGILTAVDLEPIELVDAPVSTPFERIRCRPRTHVGDGPLVSVIMTTYCPDELLDVAVRSILEQSWRNLELLILDDGSPAEEQAALDKWEGIDARIRIVRDPRNRGTYPARNTALDLAAGEFVTFQDSDDWSHPRRIEWQLARMIDSDAVATRSSCVRVSERLEFNQLGYLPIRPNCSSLMMRRREVMDRVGYFDPVRKAADTEHHQRLMAVFGDRVVDLAPAPLAFILRRTDSLSRSDFAPGWHAPVRRAYRTAYEYWHRQIWAGAEDPYVSADPLQRRFPVPRGFRSTREVLPGAHDVVLAGDWRVAGGPQRAMVAQARALTARGYRVALTQLESLQNMSARMAELADPVQEIVNDGLVDQVSLEDDVRARLLLVEDPRVLQYAPSARVRMEVDRIVVAARETPYGRSAEDHRYDVSRCVSNIRELFGRNALWIPRGAALRRVLRSVLPVELLAGEDLPEAVDPQEWYTERRSPRGPRPVVGWLPPEDRSSWRRFDAELVASSPNGASVELRTLGASATGAAAADVDLKEFLAGIDFFVHFPLRKAGDAPDRLVLEALASGAVVLLPRSCAEVFGDAAVCCSAPEAMRHIARLYERPDDYRRQSEKGRAYVASRLRPASYVDAVGLLMEPEPAGADAAEPVPS